MWGGRWIKGRATARPRVVDVRRDRPRLLCLMQMPPPVHGVTMVNQIVAHSDHLASRFELEVLPLSFAASLEDIERLSLRKLGRMVATSARLAHALVMRRPDAVYFTLAPTGSAFYRDCCFVAIMKLLGVPRIYHLHGKGIRDQLGSIWRRRLYAWAFREAWVIHLAQRLVEDLGELVPRGRVLVVPNGIATRPVAARSQRADRPRLLFLSNMIESKGPLVLVEALAMLVARGHDLEATFAGADAKDGCLARFHAEIRRNGLERHVRYVGAVYGEHKHRLLDEHDVFVFPTCKDAFPLVALEAMQAGLPVVTTYEGALPDIVEDGETGLLVARRDPAALARCLEVLIANPATQHRMGMRGKERQERWFTLAAFEQNLAAALAACTQAAHA